MVSKNPTAKPESLSAPEKRIRLFIAINLPAALKSRLGELQHELESSANKRAVRWTRPEQLHITLKFIGYVEAALPLFRKAGVPESLDNGFMALAGADGCSEFIATCRQLRFWAREATVKQV